MSKPWEKYAKQSEVDSNEGPWSKYQNVKTVAPSESALRGAISGVTAGFDDEITGALGAVGRVFGVKNLGSAKPFDPNSKYEMTDEPLSVDEILKAYRENRDAIRNEQKKDMAVNPASTIAGNIGGSFFSPISKIQALGTSSKLANAVKTGAMQGAAFAAGSSDSDLTKGEVKKFASDTALGAGIGASVPLAFEGIKIGSEKIGNGISNLGKKFFAARTGTSVENNSKYWNNAKEINAAPELAMIKDGVDEAVSEIKKGVDAGKINVEQAKGALSELKTNVRNGLVDAKVDAREAVRQTENLFKDASEKLLQPIKSKRPPTELANEIVNSIEELRSNMFKKSNEAYKTLDSAFPGVVSLENFYNRGRNLVSEIRKEATPEAISIANNLSKYLDNVSDLVKNTENVSSKVASNPKTYDLLGSEKVNEKSLLTFLRSKGGLNKIGQSNDVLDLQANNLYRKNGMDVDRAIEVAKENGYLLPDEGLNDLISKIQKELSGKKQYPIGTEDNKYLNDYIKNLSTKSVDEVVQPRELDARSVKKLIKGLDNVSEYGNNATTFDKNISRYYKDLRATLDQDLKNTIPGYKEAILPVSKDASLLEDLRSFGEERSAIGKLSQISSPKGKLDRELLANLEKSIGNEGAFTKPIDEYTRAQELLKNTAKIEEMKRALPEYAAYRGAMAKLAKMKPEWTRDQLERALSNSKEARALAMAEDAFKKAQEKFNPVSKLTRDSTQAKLESFLKPAGPKIEVKRSLQELEKLSGKKFINDLENRAVLDSFSKSAMNGSRNTIYGSLMGGVIGSLFGGVPMGAAGLSTGAIYGQMVDKYGPKMAKSIMDGLLSIKNRPSVQAIRSLSLPEGVKNELEREFNVYMILRNSNKGELNRVADSENNSDRSPSNLKGEALWAQKGMNKLGLDDQNLLENKEIKALLIQASELPENSKKLEQIKQKIKGMGY